MTFAKRLKFIFTILLLWVITLFSGYILRSDKDAVYVRKMKEPGVRIVNIDGGYKVWTQKIGSGKRKVLLLHGGPGYTHEFLEVFANYLPEAGIETYFYEQLGCYFSDQPDDTSLWTLQRYVKEVDQVRIGLGLKDFFLFGYSWGGQLALQYAVENPDLLKGLIVSNVSFSEEAIKTRVDEIKQTLKRENPNSTDEEINKLFGQKYYRIPDILKNDSFSRAVAHRNEIVFGAVVHDLQKIKWNVWKDLPKISYPVLLMTGRNDYASSPDDIRKMCRQIQNCKTYISENASHLLFHDEPASYFDSLIKFIKQTD